MSEHKATLRWERGGAEFSYQKYPRDHSWSFDGGHTMTGTAAPAYLGNPANVDPEEAFVASLSSCHMLTFLAIACKQKFVLDSYEDEAVGHMEKNAHGKMAITRVELHPKIKWSGERTPSEEELEKLHHAALYLPDFLLALFLAAARRSFFFRRAARFLTLSLPWLFPITAQHSPFRL